MLLLGKQGWKFLTDPDALVSRVFKAKYFPKGDFLSAPLGYRPSYVWRSITATQAMLREGFRWRIEDCRALNVWTEPWLRDDQSCYIETVPNMQLDELTDNELQLKNLTVHDLLIPDLQLWDETLINLIFSARDAQVICNMQPPPEGGENVRIWRHEKRGHYSVKSAYRVAQERCGRSPSLREDGPWKQLWRLTLQPKLKHMVWRFSKGVAATRSILMHRGVALVDECGCCSAIGETLEHLVFECSLARGCWVVSGLLHWVSSLEGFNTDIKRWLFAVVTSGAEHLIQKTLAILWGVWRERNDRVFLRKATTPEAVSRRSLDELQEWMDFQKERLPTRPRRTAECPRWHVPPVQMVKCNLDVAMFPHERTFGLGIVVRDATGCILQILMQQKAGVIDVREAECAAMLTALGWIQSMGYEQVVFETDNQSVARAINGSEMDVSEFGTMVSACRRILDHQPSYTVSWIRRSRDGVAHELARRSRSLASTLVGATPPDDLSFVINDVCFNLSH
ncbi:Uncharacterized mitochondrial protein AtMg00310 [Linum grandiflorum]